jgi:hypothetical protein
MLPVDLQHLQRWPTDEARRSLASRLELPFTSVMQDWEWEVADPSLLPRLFELLGDAELSDDERFSLLEIVVQSIEDLESAAPEKTDSWRRAERELRERPALHATTIWTWSCLEDGADGAEAECWALSPAMAELWEDIEPHLVELAE